MTSAQNIAQNIAMKSVLYVPGANVKALKKAATLPADCLIFDLEDSVAPSAKAQARENICAALTQYDYGTRTIIIRANGLDTQWCADDMAAIAAHKKRPACLLPKIETPEAVALARNALKESALWLMIETPLAILHIGDLAQAAQAHNVAAFIMGTNDLSKDIGAQIMPDRLGLMTALSQSLYAARHYGIAIIDGVYNAIEDMDGFTAEAQQGHQMGFDGKTLIHPSQIEPCNHIFAPSAEEQAEAQAIIAAFALPENKGAAVLRVNGKMVELLHLAQAQRLLARAPTNAKA